MPPPSLGGLWPGPCAERAAAITMDAALLLSPEILEVGVLPQNHGQELPETLGQVHLRPPGLPPLGCLAPDTGRSSQRRGSHRRSAHRRGWTRTHLVWVVALGLSPPASGRWEGGFHRGGSQ